MLKLPLRNRKLPRRRELSKMKLRRKKRRRSTKLSQLLNQMMET